MACLELPVNDPVTPRVFVVDDEWIIAETLAAILCKSGFQAVAFHNPGQALVRALEDPPDILLADVIMPSMTGVELAIALRRAGHACRIVLFSGQAGAHDRLLEARRLGYPFELLEKPVHPLQLLLRLRNSGPQAAQAERDPALELDAGRLPAA